MADSIDEFEEVTEGTDTSAAQARKGKDIQGMHLFVEYANTPSPAVIFHSINELLLISTSGFLEGLMDREVSIKARSMDNRNDAGSLLEGLTQTQISTMAVKNRCCRRGSGELICKKVELRTLNYVGDFKCQRFMNDFIFLHRKVLKGTVGSIVGHLDYSFGPAWHPDGRTLRLGIKINLPNLGLEKLVIAYKKLKGNMGAVRPSPCCSSDGRFLVVAEPSRFCPHIYNAEGDFLESNCVLPAGDNWEFCRNKLGTGGCLIPDRDRDKRDRDHHRDKKDREREKSSRYEREKSADRDRAKHKDRHSRGDKEREKSSRTHTWTLDGESDDEDAEGKTGMDIDMDDGGKVMDNDNGAGMVVSSSIGSDSPVIQNGSDA
ncbi:hypothetical protein HAX54_028368 [Datura stramonium]|uniref:Uncharacterized protein n=1 Tax=Datura stramonium TaxID=4076 RepID=A0ABS8V5H0_DATST|nr:hypothetical protein [Datura stramonium]